MAAPPVKIPRWVRIELLIVASAIVLCGCDAGETASSSQHRAGSLAPDATSAIAARQTERHVEKPVEMTKPPSRPLILGMNLATVADWSREWALVDVFQASRPWISQNSGGGGPWDNGQRVEVDAAGWPRLKPGQAATTLLCRELDGHYPAGQYTCTYEGSGEIAWGFDARVLHGEPGRVTLDVSPSNAGILLRIDRSDAQDPIRNVHVYMPGMDRGSSAFHPLYLERVKPFRVIRFMDWGGTNDSPVKSWADRNTLSSARQSGPRGVAPELMIDLCNALGADAWFCMPHQADDDYVRHFAELARDRIHDKAKIYVEWSNEAWNDIFQQARWVQDQAGQRRCRWTWVIADEARRDWDIWREAFRDHPERVVRVAAGQHYNPWVAQDIALRLGGNFDAIACAAYFYPQAADVATFDAHTSPEAVLESCRANLDGPARKNWHEHALLAASWSRQLRREIPLLAYEAGQHLTTAGQSLPYGDVYARAQVHPQMHEVYRQLLEILRAEGFDAALAFNYVGRQDAFGSWGHLRYQDEPLADAPKFRAVWEAARRQP